jgi:hypothetical protein
LCLFSFVFLPVLSVLVCAGGGPALGWFADAGAGAGAPSRGGSGGCFVDAGVGYRVLSCSSSCLFCLCLCALFVGLSWGGLLTLGLGFLPLSGRPRAGVGWCCCWGFLVRCVVAAVLCSRFFLFLVLVPRSCGPWSLVFCPLVLCLVPFGPCVFCVPFLVCSFSSFLWSGVLGLESFRLVVALL